jgi:signal transduction histidine kinase
LPLVVFSYKEISYIYFGLAISAILMLFFDPIHDLLGVGYKDLLGEPKRGYFISGVYYSMAYLFTVGVFLFFKRSNNKLFRKSVDLITELNESNLNLSSLVDEKTEKLKASNEELISHNSELQHFSNTVSHNLRGPVANILGLANLFDLDKSENANAELTEHIKSSAESLDNTLKDLNKIIDIRNHLFQIKENVFFSEEFDKVKEVLKGKIKSYDAKISIDFKEDSLYCIRSYMNSIMYNLLSNALKYRDAERTCEINVSTYAENGNLILAIEDNGIGIDLEKYGHQVFGMYKRFHDHIDGKGLGLFLTKQQVESLGGKIILESTPGVGTKFTVTCPMPKIELISEQVYFESDVATIWFDAVNFISTLVWKKEPSSDEYKEALSRNLEIFRTYKCYGCIADVRKLGMVNESDRDWFINNILADAPEIGMQKFIVVHDSNDGKDDEYFEGMREAVESHGIFFDHDSYDMEEAKKVIRSIDVK